VEPIHSIQLLLQTNLVRMYLEQLQRLHERQLTRHLVLRLGRAQAEKIVLTLDTMAVREPEGLAFFLIARQQVVPLVPLEELEQMLEPQGLEIAEQLVEAELVEMAALEETAGLAAAVVVVELQSQMVTHTRLALAALAAAVICSSFQSKENQ
jgi:hypothetical protein